MYCFLLLFLVYIFLMFYYFSCSCLWIFALFGYVIEFVCIADWSSVGLLPFLPLPVEVYYNAKSFNKTAYDLNYPSVGLHVTGYLPTHMDGDKGNVILFTHQPEAYGEEATRCAFLRSLLTRRALDWAIAVWDNDIQVRTSSLYFTHQIRNVFKYPVGGQDLVPRPGHHDSCQTPWTLTHASKPLVASHSRLARLPRPYNHNGYHGSLLKSLQAATPEGIPHCHGHC